LKVILNRATQLLKAQDSSIAVYNSETNLIHKLAHSKPKYQSVVLRMGEGVSGRVIATGEPVIINDLQHWKDLPSVYKDSPYNTILSVPLSWQGEVFGALIVTNKRGARPFNNDDIKLMSLFADLASIALKNSELFTQVTHLSQNLEHKVEQRTTELVKVQKELAQKATQLQQVLGQMVRVQEEERTRIALDLHDGSNQLITGTLFEIQAAQQSIRNQGQTIRTMETLETAKRLLRQVEAENRRIISGLRPPILDAQGLVPTVRWQATTCQKYYGLICSVKVVGPTVRLSSEVEIAIYRVVQESLNNIVTHAHAETAQICLTFNRTTLQITIQDDGFGFDQEDVLVTGSHQMGLIGIRERIQSIGGRININSKPGHGTRITLDVPLVAELVPQTVSV
jgi:signal transduction histidine kinase